MNMCKNNLITVGSNEYKRKHEVFQKEIEEKSEKTGVVQKRWVYCEEKQKVWMLTEHEKQERALNSERESALKEYVTNSKQKKIEMLQARNEYEASQAKLKTLLAALKNNEEIKALTIPLNRIEEYFKTLQDKYTLNLFKDLTVQKSSKNSNEIEIVQSGHIPQENTQINKEGITHLVMPELARKTNPLRTWARELRMGNTLIPDPKQSAVVPYQIRQMQGKSDNTVRVETHKLKGTHKLIEITAASDSENILSKSVSNKPPITTSTISEILD